MIFGGEAFKDLIGEISLMKDLTKTMEITVEEMEEQELAAAAEEKLNIHEDKEQKGEASTTPATGAAPAAAATEPKPASAASAASPNPVPPTSVTEETTSAPSSSTADTSASGTSTPKARLGQQALMERSEEEARMDAAGLTPEEKELRKKEKKKGLSKEQRDKLAAYELERKKARDERVEMLSKKLIDRISVWTETDKNKAVTKAFEDQTKLEVENLKMESFGLEILHAVGTTYIQKATSFLKSQKFLGISGFFSRLKDKGTLAKETWNTVTTALDAQMTMEEMAKLEEKGGDDWTDEKKAEYERKVTGKILAAAWRGSKFEIQSVLRDVCDQILNDKSVKLEKRIERAQALVICGTIFQKVQVPHPNPNISQFHLFLSTNNLCSRPNATPKKKAITWPLNNSWPTAWPRRVKKRTRRRRRKRRRKSTSIIISTLLKRRIALLLLVLLLLLRPSGM